MRIIAIVVVSALVVVKSTVVYEEVYVQPDLNEYIPPERSVDSEYPSCTLPFGSGLANMGVCVPPTYFADELGFCGEYVRYAACVPPRQPLWGAWNATSKDRLLERQFKVAVDARISQEMTKDQLGNYIQIRFSQNMECIEAFKRALCWANFPACGEQDGKSFPVCLSACQDYMTACKYADFSSCSANPSWPLPPSTEPMTLSEGAALQCTGSAASSGERIAMLITILAFLLNSLCCLSNFICFSCA